MSTASAGKLPFRISDTARDGQPGASSHLPESDGGTTRCCASRTPTNVSGGPDRRGNHFGHKSLMEASSSNFMLASQRKLGTLSKTTASCSSPTSRTQLWASDKRKR